MLLRLNLPHGIHLQRRAEVLKELENIKLDFCPDYQDDARVEDELQNYTHLALQNITLLLVGIKMKRLMNMHSMAVCRLSCQDLI